MWPLWVCCYELWSHLWHKVSRIYSHSHAESPQSMRPLIPSLQAAFPASSTVEEDQFIPAAWIQAARWSACASAPPSCPCSSDSLSSAAECLPGSDILRTPPLQTHKKESVWGRKCISVKGVNLYNSCSEGLKMCGTLCKLKTTNYNIKRFSFWCQIGGVL